MSVGVITVYPRHRGVRALRFIKGSTTKSMILGFCPNANVGVRCEFVNGVLTEFERDIRWVAVPAIGNHEDYARMKHDGDWIVEVSPGEYDILTDVEFWQQFTER